MSNPGNQPAAAVSQLSGAISANTLMPNLGAAFLSSLVTLSYSISYGALIFSISTGLTIQMCDHGNIIAFYGVDKLRFTHPTFIGDTIHVTKRVIELVPKDEERGVVAFETQVINQHQQPVVVYQDRVLLRRRQA